MKAVCTYRFAAATAVLFAGSAAIADGPQVPPGVHQVTPTGGNIIIGAFPQAALNGDVNFAHAFKSSNGVLAPTPIVESSPKPNHGSIAGSPPNDNCANADMVTLNPGDSHTFVGNNQGATHECASFPAGEGHVWIAFELTDASSVTLEYCGSSGVWGNAWLNLALGCPCTGFTGAAAFAFNCPDGNVEMTWAELDAGTYYYPVMLDIANGAVGDYNITVTAGAPVDVPIAVYSNVTNAVLVATTHGSDVLADDLQTVTVTDVSHVTFSVVHFGASNLASANVDLFFWELMVDDEGFIVAPQFGQELAIVNADLDFAPLPPATLSLPTIIADEGESFFTIPDSQLIWAGVRFNSANFVGGGALGDIGQAFFNPPTVGASEDVAADEGFDPTEDFTLIFFGGDPVANFGWEIAGEVKNVFGGCCFDGVGPGPDCPGDLNNDGVVNVFDLLILLGDWGTCPGCDADLNNDGVVNVFDLLILLGNWGTCPVALGATCELLPQGECTAAGGLYLGDFSDCSLCVPALNNSCADAIDITGNIGGPPVIGNNLLADVDDPDLPFGSPSCQWDGNPDAAHNTVWYTVEAPENGALVIQTCNSQPPFSDSIIAIYTGQCGSLQEIGCDEDGCTGAAPFYDRLQISGLTPGQTYYISISNTGGWAGSVPGEFTLGVSSPSNCCIPWGGIGCDNAECEALVCANNDFCCTFGWDEFCAFDAEFFCEELCTGGVGSSCQGNCGGQAPDGCWCDAKCCVFLDCCADEPKFCGNCNGGEATCEGFCGGQSPAGCWCDDKCCGFLDCCPDEPEHCGNCL